jgi:hypothetical protein
VGCEGVTRSRSIDAGLLLVLAAALVYGTWILPYRFPQRGFVIGASNEVGFNNSVSFFAYLLCVPLMAWVVSRWLRPAMAPHAAAAGGVSAAAIATAVIGAHVLLFGALYAYKGRFVFAEGLYFQSLLYRMSTGEIPYLDFSFYYGPLMLYPAYWLSRVVGLDLAYGIWFIATYTTGLVFLYVVLRSIMQDERRRAFWFVLLALGLFNPLTGLNETFTRYLFPSIVFLSAAAFLQRGGAARAVGTSVLLAAAVTYSFEVAALSIAAVGLLWLAFSAIATPSVKDLLRRTAIVMAGGGVCSVAFFLAVDPSGSALREYPDVARSYSGGAHNVPLYPHLPFIALAAITVGALAALIAFARDGRDRVVAAAAVAYAVVALIAQRASFGAAEPSHFAYFGVPVFCLALLLTMRVAGGEVARSWLAVALVIGIMLPMQYYHAMEFVPFFAARLGAQKVSAATAEDVPPVSSSDLEQDLREVVRTIGADRPYVMYEMEYVSLPVFRDFGLRYGSYYTMLITARDYQGIDRAIADIRRSGAVVVARKQDLASLGRTHRSSGVLRLFDRLSGAHTAGSDLNELLLKSRSRLTKPFVEFVANEYVPLYERHGLVAYGPRN